MRCATNPCGTLHPPNPRWGCYNYEVIKVKHQMTATQIQLKVETEDFITYLLEENYHDEDIYEFINEHGEDNFVEYYEQYVELGEENSYGAVDAFIAEFSLQDLDNFEDAYRGEYSSKADYAEQFVSDCYCIDMPSFVEIDWEASFDNMDCIYVDGFVFDTQF